MKDIFNNLIEGITFTSDLAKDSNNFLIKHNRFRIGEHSLRVAQKAKILARQYGVDENLAIVAGLLHDIGGVYPNDKRIECDQDGLPPYIDEIERASNISLELVAFTYLKYLHNNRLKLKVIHPWLAEAYKELKEELI